MKPILLDGSTGRLLQQRIGTNIPVPDALVLSHPEDVTALAAEYYAAGSDIVLTNTFGASPLSLKKYGLESKVADINTQAARVVQDIKPDDRCVFASIGPSGEFLMMGSVTEDGLQDSYARQAEVLERAGVDGYFLETFMDLDELVCAVKGIQQHSSQPIFCSLTYEKTKQETAKTIMGVSPSYAAEHLQALGITTIGINCGDGFAPLEAALQEYSSIPDIYLIAKPNAGVPELIDGIEVYSETADSFAQRMQEMISKYKPAYIGGCCGSTPEYIAAIRKIIDAE